MQEGFKMLTSRLHTCAMVGSMKKNVITNSVKHQERPHSTCRCEDQDAGKFLQILETSDLGSNSDGAFPKCETLGWLMILS